MASISLATTRRLHSSIVSHLSTELSLLQALKDKSKYQHRSQIFNRRMGEVLRLGTALQGILKWETEQEKRGSERGISAFLRKFTEALTDATLSTQQIIDLNHFLPLQVTLLAIYARLFTIVSNVAQSQGIAATDLFEPEKRAISILLNRKEDVLKQDEQNTASATELDFGARMTREAPLSEISTTLEPAGALKSSKDSTPTMTEKTVALTEAVLGSEDRSTSKRIHSEAAASRPPKKKPKGNIMDDIFR